MKLMRKKLESFRKKSKKYLYPSFNTIAGSGKNGARFTMTEPKIVDG